MRLTYWTRYDRLYKNFSTFDLFFLVRELALKLGPPFINHDGRGRKPKVRSVDYAAYIAFQILLRGATFRMMEFESRMFLGKHVDHATFSMNLEKIPTSYFLDLVEEAGARLDALLAKTKHYVADSTAITTPRTFETMIKGRKVVEHVEFKAHAIAAVHRKDHCVVIRKALTTEKNIADCEGARIMLNENTIRNVTLHTDMGYDYERVYIACFKNKIKPNIRPQDYIAPQYEKRERGKKDYDDKARRKYRGLIETVFGGFTNAKLLITRLFKKTKILSYAAIILLRHNILNILKHDNL